MLSSSDRPFHHFLIGAPASGKSSFARILQQTLGGAEIISTDQIRERLYGNAAQQGSWTEIEAEVQRQFRAAIAADKTIIYDATNVKRAWRLGILQSVRSLDLDWVAWELKTNLATCKVWNQQRQRMVPEALLEQMYAQQRQLRPIQGEGYVSLVDFDPVKVTDFPQFIEAELRKCPRSRINHANRYSTTEVHGYSQLLDFDRLIHLLSLLSRYPGLGQLHQQEPQLLRWLLNSNYCPTFEDPIAEIAAVLKAKVGAIYADPAALAADLAWLEAEGFWGAEVDLTQMTLPDWTGDERPQFFHHHSDRHSFERLMKTLRFMIRRPLTQEDQYQQQAADDPETKLKRIDILAQQLLDSGILQERGLQAMIRKDIEWVLHPYQIFPEKTMRKGYYLGTGILSHEDLQQIFLLADKQAAGLKNPLDKRTVERFQERLQWARIDPSDQYPVRSITGGSIVSPDLLSSQSLATESNAQQVEQAIRTGQAIRIGKLSGTGQYDGQLNQEQIVWPLQIVFHTIAWYLACEVAHGEDKGRYFYERLDRLYGGYFVGTPRSKAEHLRSLKAIQCLQDHSFGLFLGRDRQAQQQFLAKSESERLKAMTLLELHFREDSFRFAAEGTQRFPKGQLKMSLPEGRSLGNASPAVRELYSLPKAKDPNHPYQMRVLLPDWSLEEITLQNWIKGWGAGVKVIAPLQLRDSIRQHYQEAAALYAES
ncbi:AAA family ATPase [Synechococcus elongatus IITB4]|uniref:AAA family ATPase n=1 Tax=Synechococcus elongatus TaxID=32046 RepID=UPI0030D0286A